MTIIMKKPLLSAAVLLLAAALCVVSLASDFRSMQEREPIYPGPGVTSVRMLSDWFPGIHGTPGDTEVYILEGKKPGSSMLVLGGTHANEPSGVLAATLLVENAQPEEGTLYVITHTNQTGFTCTDPQEAAPMRFMIDTPAGPRWFRYGSRASNPIYQWPDPEIYVHASSGQQLSGSETRNLNRAYPGRPDGTLTEKIAYAITELIRTEKIAVEVDLHEASPEYPTINAIVAHENAMGLASDSLINMQLEGMEISLEPSPKNLHGLSHREIGDFTDAYALLMETSNPAQGRLRGRTDEHLVVTGQDKFYLKAFGYGRLYVPYDENGHPISQRVARHVTGIAAFANSYTEMNLVGERGGINLGTLPGYEELESDIGPYLCPKA